MKLRNTWRTLAVLITISLLLLAMPATPALAATIVLSPTSGPAGTQVTVTGTLFSGYSTVYIFFGNTVMVAAAVSTIYPYNINATFSVPTSAALGLHLVTVSSNLTVLTAISPSVYFTVTQASIALNQTSGIVGTNIGITGTGFPAGTAGTVYFDNASTATFVSNTDGSISTSFTVPSHAAGTYKVKVTAGSQTIETDFIVLPQMTITPDSGAIGNLITVTGVSYNATKTISFTFDGTTLTTSPAVVTSDSTGSFTARFNIPTSSGGSHTVIASDGANSKTANLVVQATATLDKTSGNVGTEVSVTGSGFLAGQPVTVYFDNTSIAANIIGADGSFTTSFTVPSHAAGTFKVKVTDLTNIIEINFQILTSAQINQTSGHVGTGLTISGIGFTVGQIVTITYDGTQVPGTATLVAADGSFSVTFNVPASSGGQHVITASDTVINQSFNFVMESTPPSIVFAQLPLAESKLADWRFDWSGSRDDLAREVTDDSLPITYTLQIATNASFTADSIIVEKAGLTQSEYTLTTEERLPSVSKDAPYYWRVRAIDAAYNPTAWTGTGTFLVGFSFSLPRPVLITLIIVGALAIAGFSFWLGRKTAYY